MDQEIDFKKLTAALRADHESLAEEQLHPISLPRAIRVAFRPSMLDGVDRAHLKQCAVCRRRIERARATGHPEGNAVVAYLRGSLSMEDRAEVMAHFEQDCHEPLCLVAQMDRWAKWAEDLVKAALTTPLTIIAPGPQEGMAYSSTEKMAPAYSHISRNGDFEVLLEEQAGNVLFVAIRSTVLRTDVTEVFVAIGAEGRTQEARLPWQSGQAWSARMYLTGARELLNQRESIEVIILPVLAMPSEV